MAASNPGQGELVTERQTKNRWYPEHWCQKWPTSGVEERTCPPWGPLTLGIPRSELTYTYTTTLGKPTEEAVFETDQHGRPTALAGVAATARAALTEANRRRSRALKGLEDAFNRSLRRSEVSGLGKNHQVRWRRRDPYAVPYRDDHHPGSLCLL